MMKLHTRHTLHVLRDIYVQYMIWALWAAGITMILFILGALFLEPLRSLDQSAYALIGNLSNIFMFVVGVITGYYLIQYFVRMGVTRRSYFSGTIAAALCIACSIQVIGLMLTLISFAAEVLTPFQAGRDLVRYLGQSYGYPLTMTISAVLLVAHFLAAWVIGHAFYQYRFIGKTLSIVQALVVLAGLSALWDSGSTMITIRGKSVQLAPEISLPGALAITFLVLLLQATLLYRLIREAPVQTQ